MKIKITLIAFFASALMLTSCMKNEVSPGVESIRTAYAAFLNAKAQAELIKANADAALTLAQADVQKAEATYRIAQAKGVDATTAQALEVLKQAIEMNKVALDAAKRAEQALLDAYLAGVVTTKNALVTTYFTNYKNALIEVNNVQDLIYDKQKAIVDLRLDLVNGTDLGLTNAKATLAAKQARLAALEAELADAKTILGNVDAAYAKVAELQIDSTTLENELKTLAAEMTTQIRLIDSTAYKGKVTDEATALGKYNTAVTAAIRDTAAARFLRDTILMNNVPSWWRMALDSVANTEGRLAANAADTTQSGIDYRAALATIAAGTTVQTAAWNLKKDSITAYLLAISNLVTDSSNKFDAWYADTVALSAAIADTLAHDATHAANVISMASHWVAWHMLPYGPARTGDSLAYWAGYADSVYYVSAGEFLDNVAVTAAKADTAISGPLWRTSESIFNAQHPGLVSFLGTNPNATTDATLYGRKNIAYAAISTQADLVAAATLALPDLRSNYLYHLTFNVPLREAVVLAKAYKESKRVAYETWRDTYYTATYLVFLDSEVTRLEGLWNAAKLATATAKTNLMAQAANIELVRLIALQKTATTSLGHVKALIPLWKNVTAGQDAFLAAFEAAITTAEGEVTTAEGAVVTATNTYETGRVNYDKFTADMVELNARLTAAQAQVVFWKALLDEAIASAN